MHCVCTHFHFKSIRPLQIGPKIVCSAVIKSRYTVYVYVTSRVTSNIFDIINQLNDFSASELHYIVFSLTPVSSRKI